MSTHPFPDNADPRALALVMLAERDNTPALLTIYSSSGCECTLGRVYRVNDFTVLTGTTVVRVLTRFVDNKERHERRHQRYAVLLDDPDQIVELDCVHGGGVVGELHGQTLARVRAAVAAVRHYGATMAV